MGPGATPVLRGERVALRPVAEADVGALTAILREPEVARWWGDYTDERARRELTTEAGWAIEVDGRVAGWLSVTQETDPDYRHAAFDIFPSSAAQGRGLGREALDLAVRHLAACGHHRFTIDPARGQRAGDPLLRGGRLPPGRGHARIRARPRRRLARQPAHGPAG